jgi:response regulator RpfG family c-di-GMP phosphodiesterase
MVMSNPQILIVDDEDMIRDLLFAALTREGYACVQAGNAADALSILNSSSIQLALFDIMMPGKSGLDLLKEAKTLLPDLAIIMITALSDMNTALSCIHLGAEDYIVKPFTIDRIAITVKNLLEKQRLQQENREYSSGLEKRVLDQTNQIRQTMLELNQAYDQTLTTLVRALDAREKEIGSHSERVMNYTRLLATACGIEGKERDQMTKGALLHDIGKIGVPDTILLKPGKLTDDEWLEMKRHPQIGFDILSGVPFLKEAAAFVLSHHERFDGKGYPSGLQAQEIPLSARIFSLVDTLDAMTSDRPYRNALPFTVMLEEIRHCSGTQFDPDIVNIFLRIPKSAWEEAAGRLLP